MEIRDCQDVQTEPGDTLGRHAPQLRRVCSAQREGVNPKRRSDARAEEHSCRDDGKTHACFEESEQTFQMCHLEPAGFKAAAEGSLGSGSASLPSSGQPRAHCSSVFISYAFQTLFCKSWPPLRECVCCYISSNCPVCVNRQLEMEVILLILSNR